MIKIQVKEIKFYDGHIKKTKNMKIRYKILFLIKLKIRK